MRKVQVSIFGLVRDASGRPKIDGDPRALPQPVKEMLTKSEYEDAIREYDDAHS